MKGFVAVVSVEPAVCTSAVSKYTRQYAEARYIEGVRGRARGEGCGEQPAARGARYH